LYQDVFIKVHKHLADFKFESEFFTWLYRITVNVCLSHVKKRKRYASESIEDWEIGKDDDHRKIMIEEIEKEAEKLPEKQKMAFFLRFQNDLKIQEIANIMQIDEGTVKGYLSRSVGRIRSVLGLGV
jgi:RNA polymerase sigma-70 factor (ECF subfamily)